MYDKHDLPCWKGCGTSCCSLFNDPKPHLHCFKCGEQNWHMTEEEIIALELNIVPFIDETKIKAPRPLERGMVAAMSDRGITKETAERYRVETLYDDNNTPIGRAFNHFDAEGNIFAQKVKNFDGFIKNNGKHEDVVMFGMNLFPLGGKFLTITEGEEDAMAAYQMMKSQSPSFEPSVISIPDGAASAEKACKKAWEYINSFENIIIAFDGDDVGKKAADKIAKLFDYKPRILLFSEAKKNKDGVWEYKDANDYLKAGKVKEFVNLWWRSERMQPKGVLSFKSLWDSMTKEDTDITVTWPWEGLNKKSGGGLSTGQFVVVKASPKIGKTALLRELAYHIRCESTYNVGLIFLEDTKKSIGMGMCALHMSKPIQFGNIPYTLDELQKSHEFMSADDRLTIFDPEDDRTVENIFNKIMYFVKAHECKFIILDHISMLAYQSADNDERRFLDKLCADLKALTTSLNIGIVAVIHTNDDGKTRGSRAPVQLCNLLINLNRDKLNSDPIIANTTEVIVEENRKTGDSGLACKLFFDRDTGRMTELDQDLTLDNRAKFDT